jgi:hypothetical protein
MSIQEAKARIAIKYGFNTWTQMLFGCGASVLDLYIDEVVLLYHNSQKNL